MTIKVPPRQAARQYPLGNHPILFTEAILAGVIITLVDNITYRATPEAIAMVAVLAAVMVAVAALAIRVRYVRKAARRAGGRANTQGTAGDA